MTLSVDVGGSGVKANVLDDTGQVARDRVRVPTPYPLTPPLLISVIADLARQLPPYDRVSVGFPGMVRAGRIITAPQFVSPAGLGGAPSADLVTAWQGFDLRHSIEVALGKPSRVANDADVQGSAVVTGTGLEVVLTLGTGFGSAVFWEGKLAPHLELSHHPLHKDRTYNEVLGDSARRAQGAKKWNKRVSQAIAAVRALLLFDHCYIGGGNATKVEITLPPDVTLIDNSAGILGGVHLWNRVD